MDNLPPVILASASPRRSQLLASMDIEFEVVPSHVEELIDGYDFIPDLCEANARIKAEPIADMHPECLVIAADTMVYLEDTLFGKPTDIDDAHRMLTRLQGRTHQVTTGVSLIYHNEAISGSAPNQSTSSRPRIPWASQRLRAKNSPSSTLLTLVWSWRWLRSIDYKQSVGQGSTPLPNSSNPKKFCCNAL